MNESNLQTLQQQQQPCYVKIIPPTSLIDVLETFYRQGKTQFRIELAQLCCGVSQKQDTYEKIQDLLEVCPLLVKAKRASDGNLPLHICAHLGWVELGSLIANAYPEATESQNDKGKTPLHIAAKDGCEDFVALLLRLNPRVAQIITKKFKLPLHFAAGNGHTNICEQLVAAYPEGASKLTAKSKLPLHLASRDGNIDAVRLLLQAYPKGTSTPDWECKTPLHRAIRDMHEDVASLLIDQDPNALKSESMSGNLPIDITMRMPSSFELFSKMARTWPGGCKNVLEKIGTDEDIHNWQWSKIELSLRYAADLIHPSSVSSASASLSGKKKKNKKKKKKNKKILPQYFPLHTALYLTQNNSLLQRVIDSNLDLVNKRDKMGELPLHIALERYNNTAKEHIQRLIDLYPDGAAQRDSLGRLPLHIALVKRCDLSIIDALLLANPKSVIDCFSRGEGEIMKKPIFLALEAGCNVDILYTLLKFDPSVFNCIQ